jgi:hypothetical protein
MVVSNHKQQRGIGMKKYLRIGLMALSAVAFTTSAFAQNSGAPVPGEGADGTIFKGLTASNNYFATKYVCKDGTGSASSISAAIADCCISGDIWRATIYRGNNASQFQNTANTSQFTAGAAAFAPDVYSPNATITPGFGNVKAVIVVATMGNQTPGGLPAGGTLRVQTSPISGPTCARKQVVNGTATP